jgi:lantibiotic modifying enzyme
LLPLMIHAHPERWQKDSYLDTLVDTELPYLKNAVRVGQWLATQGDRESNGMIPDEIAAKGKFTASLGDGAAGRMLFFLELYLATNEPRYLKIAEREGETALNRTADRQEKLGLYNGLAGVAFALTELSKISEKKERYRLAAEKRFKRVVRRATWTGKAGRWNKSNDILTGNAGIGLAMLYAAREFRDPDFSRAARGAGSALVEAAEKMIVGVRWHRSTDRKWDLPNFSHGTAGIAYFIATLGTETNDRELLAIAENGAAYLENIAGKNNGLFLIPYGVPNDGFSTKFDIGWAHGPAGTGRLFYRLWKITKKDKYRKLAHANAQSILAAGIPIRSSDKNVWGAKPFKLDRRFGLSGSVAFLLDLYGELGNSQYLGRARQTVNHMLRAGYMTRTGLSWKLEPYRFQCPNFKCSGGKMTYTGYLHGTSGIGFSFLEMHLAEKGERRRIRFPDDPFLSGIAKP